MAKNVSKSKRRSVSASSSANDKISVWEIDPGSGSEPTGGPMIFLPVPDMKATSLPCFIKNPGTMPKLQIYDVGTEEFRYWNTASALSRGSEFWSKLLPGVSWQLGKQLPVDLNAGIDLNAYYNRINLSFFHKLVKDRDLFSCESADVVLHEQGHAILDSIKPQLWDAASLESEAFHESFGDMSAILVALQLKSVRLGVIAETEGALYSTSRLSRMAEQLGWGIRQRKPNDVDPDCLRNAVNSHFYQPPNKLPSSAPASGLSSESHSFSRVFTGAFFEGLAGMFKLGNKKNEAYLLQVANDMGVILVEGVKAASVVPAFYSQVAVNMIQVAASKFPNSDYRQALKSAFVRHGIISPSTTAAFTSTTISSERLGITANDSPEELPKLRLSISEYDLGIDSIIVHAASEPKRFDVAGAALAFGSETSPAEDESARSFLEELLRRGRIKVKDGKNGSSKSFEITRPSAPDTHDTHTHELQLEGEDYVLRRIRIACNFGDVRCNSHHKK